MISWNYPPRGWAFCDGTTLPISTNQALFALIGTTYGGDGITTFKLPDLRGRAPTGVSAHNKIGSTGGSETHVVTNDEYPAHTHSFSFASTPGDTGQPSAGCYVASYEQAFAPFPTPPPQVTNLEPSDISAAGGSQPHENRQPFLCVPFAIALTGIFPTRD